jgi:hypothetical protein
MDGHATACHATTTISGAHPRTRPWLQGGRVALPYVAATLAAFHYVRGVATYMVTVRPDAIDFDVYYRAAQAFAAGHHIYPDYSGCCFNPAAMDGYTYPPVLAVVMSPLTALPVGVAGRIFFGLSQLALVAALVVMQRTVRGMLPQRTQVWLLAAVLLFQPIHAANFGLQVDHFLLLLFALAAWGYVHARGGALGGVAVGLATALKIAPAQMLAALLTDRRRRAVASAIGFGLATAIPLLLVWPLVSETPSYFTEVLPRFAGGVASDYSRSFAGVVLRTYTVTGHIPPSILASAFHALELGGLVLTWLVCRRTITTPAGRAATFAAFLAIMPITSPVTWDHHQESDALAFVLLAPSLRLGTASWAAAIGGMALMSVNQLDLATMLQRAGFDPPHGVGVLVYVAAASVNLVGMALLYGAALRTAWRQRDVALVSKTPATSRWWRGGWPLRLRPPTPRPRLSPTLDDADAPLPRGLREG